MRPPDRSEPTGCHCGGRPGGPSEAAQAASASEIAGTKGPFAPLAPLRAGRAAQGSCAAGGEPPGRPLGAAQAVLGVTHSACPACGALGPARIDAEGDGVYLRGFCAEHGERRALVWRGVESWLRTQRYVKPALVPARRGGDPNAPCPEGCGLCARHEQHLCLPIVEVTGRCDLSCPCCLVPPGAAAADLAREDFGRLLDGLVAAEGRIDVLNLSGGEPLLHPDLLGLVDEALARPEVARVSVSTNGRRLLTDPDVAAELRRRDAVVCLQFDGFDDEAYRVLRGRPLAEERRQILDLLAERDVTTSLTFTAAAGLNEGELRTALDLLFGRDHVVSLMVQPLAFTGRAASLRAALGRLTLPDAVQALGRAGHPSVSPRDFVPLPCSHPACFTLAFFLVPCEGTPVSLARVVDAETLLDCLANRVFFGLDEEEHRRLRDLVTELWSGPAAAAPDTRAFLETVRQVLREASGGAFAARTAFAAAERRVKSIFVHAFQDAETFDLSRLRRCCNGYPSPDGRVVPACRRNVFGGGTP